MALRYLDADKVDLPSRAPLFVEAGHCQWCNRELTGRQRLYCSEDCTFSFYNYWCSRPAYVRATFIRDSFTCQQCGFHKVLDDRPWLPDMSNLECDHIIPLAKGGKTEMPNLQTLCKECNRKKGVTVPGDQEETLPRVIPSRDNSRCPFCHLPGYQTLHWEPPSYYDSQMIKVKCNHCGEESYIAPAPVILKKRTSDERLSAIS